MIPGQKEESTPALTERAELMLNRAGERLGSLAGLVSQRFQQTTQAFRAEADHMDELKSTAIHHRPEAKAPANQPTIARAEELVDQFGQRVSHWTMVNGLQARKAIARLREDAEDMWVEAQEMHADWTGKHERA